MDGEEVEKGEGDVGEVAERLSEEVGRQGEHQPAEEGSPPAEKVHQE